MQMIHKTVKNSNPKKFEREFQLAIDEGWKLAEEVKWRHGRHGSFLMAFFRKESLK